MYEVIHYFTDLQDNEYPYNAGDIFPRDGLTVSEERLSELSGSNNRQNKPLIKLVEEELPFSDNDITFKEKEDKKYTKTDIQRMSKAELLEMTKNTGVEGADDMTRAELAEYMLSVFGL